MNVTHEVLAAIFAFVVGASVGSFLNVCIWRLPRGESVSHPPSTCPSCRSRIRAMDNIPILSWLFLRGCCRKCAWPIPRRYPLVEAGAGVLFAFIMSVELRHADPFEGAWIVSLTRLACQAVLGAILIILAMIEWDAWGSRSEGLINSNSGLMTSCAVTLGVILAFVVVDDLVGALLGLCLLAVFLRGAKRLQANFSPA